MRTILFAIFSLSIPYISHLFSHFDRLGFPYFSYRNWLILMIVLTCASLVLYSKAPKQSVARCHKILFYMALGIVVYLSLPLGGLSLAGFKIKYILSGVIIAPILEEFSFRVVPLKYFGSRHSIAMLILFLVLINICFAAYHFTFPFWGTLSYKGFQHFIFGIAMSLIYLRLQKPYYPVLIHALANAFGMFLR